MFMMKRTLWIVFGLVIAPVLVFFAIRQIRMTHYPLPLEPSPEWEPYVSTLDAQHEALFIDSDGTLLEAELFIPNGGQTQKPAVVFTPGSGDNLFSNYPEGFIETYVLDVFLSRDMAVLLMNKRGMGQSQGNYVKNSIEGRAADVHAGVQTLQTHPSIDASHIGVIGHSQGGWVVTHAAAEYPDIAFFINLAGPTMMQIEQGSDMYKHEGQCAGLESEDLENYVARREFGTLVGIKIGQITNFGYFGFDARTQYYNPAEALQSVSSPGLYVFAENDNLVTPSLNIERMNELFEGDVPDHLSMVTIDGASHVFRLVDNPCDTDGDLADHPLSEEPVAVLNDWLSQQGY
jgi:pimeloyl-ACP methyl ester carboxylesterase